MLPNSPLFLDIHLDILCSRRIITKYTNIRSNSNNRQKARGSTRRSYVRSSVVWSWRYARLGRKSQRRRVSNYIYLDQSMGTTCLRSSSLNVYYSIVFSCRYLFGSDVVAQFNQANDIEMICRAHQLVMEVSFYIEKVPVNFVGLNSYRNKHELIK